MLTPFDLRDLPVENRFKLAAMYPRCIVQTTASTNTPKRFGQFASSDITMVASGPGYLATITVASGITAPGYIQPGDFIDVVQGGTYSANYSVTGAIVQSVTTTTITYFAPSAAGGAAGTAGIIYLRNRFRKVTFFGKKAAKTNNAGPVHVEFMVDQGVLAPTTMPITLAAGASFDYTAPEGTTFDPYGIWYQVDTANDGVTALIS